jgi:uncharacterized protein (DUF2141 family)
LKINIKKGAMGQRNGIHRKLLLLLKGCGAILCCSCASLGSPEGGAFDDMPPRLVKSIPPADAVRFNGRKIELLFDEYIIIEKPAEKVIITPPQKQTPAIRTIGKQIFVELKDSLIAGTTYTLDFTDGIVDNNEKNPLEGFAFAFSTGDTVDSLMISGLLLNAENLEPQPGAVVGIHACLHDSAFTSQPFLRTTTTNDAGRFTIRNAAPGNYRLFALKDENRNYRFDRKTEAIAFYDSLITPAFESALRQDTIWTNDLTVDTIRKIPYTRFTPDNITLFFFRENAETQYLAKTERPSQNRLVFHFNTPLDLPPALSLPDGDSVENTLENRYIPEYSPDKRDITYWLVDSLLCGRDTIRLRAEYRQTDTSPDLSPVADTLRFIWKAPRPKKGEMAADNTDFLKIAFSLKNAADIFDTLKVIFSEPVRAFDPAKIRIQQKVDTLWEDRVFPIVADSLNPRIFLVNGDWDYGRAFRIIVDSAAIFSIYGKWNDSTAVGFKFKEAEEYVNVYMKIAGGKGDGFGELLNSADKTVRTSALHDGELIFENINPGKYYLRYVEDANGNGKWDTGNYERRLQPEKVFYYPNAIDLPRKNTDLENEWNIREMPVEKQKPLEVTKNKPAQKKKPKTKS